MNYILYSVNGNPVSVYKTVSSFCKANKDLFLSGSSAVAYKNKPHIYNVLKSYGVCMFSTQKNGSHESDIIKVKFGG